MRGTKLGREDDHSGAPLECEEELEGVELWPAEGEGHDEEGKEGGSGPP